VPNLQALNLFSPKLCKLGREYQRDGRAFCRPLPIFGTRTPGYFVTPAGATGLADAIERRPDLNVDQAIDLRTFHWLLTSFLRAWVVADALEQNGAGSDVGLLDQGQFDPPAQNA